MEQIDYKNIYQMQTICQGSHEIVNKKKEIQLLFKTYPVIISFHSYFLLKAFFFHLSSF